MPWHASKPLSPPCACNGADAVKLDAGVMQRLEALINQRTVSGDRYNDQANREVDTEVFAD